MRSQRIQEIRARAESVSPRLIERLNELMQKVARHEPCYQKALVCAVEAIKIYEKDVPELLAQNAALQAENERFSDCWIWQEPDGANSIESMAGKLNVLIPAKRLQEIFAENERLREVQRKTVEFAKGVFAYIPEGYCNGKRVREEIAEYFERWMPAPEQEGR